MIVESPANLEQALVAATLVAASLAVLFVIWQGDVAGALALEPNSAGNTNDKEACRTVRSVLFLRSLPLFLTATATFLILVHQICPILQEARACLGMGCPLDDVKALAVINAIVVGLLALGLLGQFISLCRHWRRLGGLVWLWRKKSAA